jgi:hypothetical protein
MFTTIESKLKIPRIFEGISVSEQKKLTSKRLCDMTPKQRAIVEHNIFAREINTSVPF